MWNTVRIYVQRKMSRHGRAVAAVLATGSLLVLVITIGTESGAESSRDRVTSAGTTGVAATDGRAVPPPQPNTAGPRASRKLAANRRLTLSPQARTQLSSGRVDQRLVTALTALLGRHRLGIAAFPGPARGALTTVSVASVDGLPIRAGERHTRNALVQLRALPKAQRPNRITITGPLKAHRLVFGFR
jgi:hypothetical protein